MVISPAQGVLALLLAAASLPALAVTAGMVDSFDAGSTAGWSTGAGSPVPPTGQTGGGPAGAADGYLLLTALGGAGAGSRLVAFSGPQWAGDYLSAGVTQITLDANNFGTNALSLRLVMESGAGRAISLASVDLAAGSGWQHLQFDVTPAALNGSAATVLGQVTQYRLIHNTAATTIGPPLAASLGIDNVTAVPEPGAAALLAAGLLGLAGWTGLAGWRRSRGPTHPG